MPHSPDWTASPDILAFPREHVAERKRSEKENIFFIFATADRRLAEIAPFLMIDADEDDMRLNW